MNILHSSPYANNIQHHICRSIDDVKISDTCSKMELFCPVQTGHDHTRLEFGSTCRRNEIRTKSPGGLLKCCKPWVDTAASSYKELKVCEPCLKWSPLAWQARQGACPLREKSRLSRSLFKLRTLQNHLPTRLSKSSVASVQNKQPHN